MKYIIPITIGETIAPKKIPNLIHSLLSGVNNLEFKTPKTKKIKDAIRAQYTISPRDIKDHNDTIKKTMKNTHAPSPEQRQKSAKPRSQRTQG